MFECNKYRKKKNSIRIFALGYYDKKIFFFKSLSNELHTGVDWF
jgi:hypothetical protein